MKRNEQVTALLSTRWQTTLHKSVQSLGGIVKITGNLVCLYSGGILPQETLESFKKAVERRDPKKLLVITIAQKDRP